MEGWNTVTLKDLLQPKGYIRGPFGSALKRGELKDQGIPVYEQQHAIYNSREFRFFIDDEKYVELKRFTVQPDDIIVSCSGTVGKVSVIKQDDPIGIISQALLTLRVDKKKVIPQYLAYYFKSREGYNSIVSRSTGSVQVNISKRDIIEAIPLRLPPLDIQEKIVALLKSYDDAIETNCVLESNLLEQAVAVFSHELVVENIPDNWVTAPLTSIADYVNGLAMQNYRPLEGERGLPVLKIKELRQGYVDETTEWCTETIKDEYVVNDGDVVFSWSGSLLVDFWCGGQCGLNQHLFRVSSSKYDKWFYYLWTLHYLDRFVSIAADKATTMGHIKRSDLKNATVIIPDSESYTKLDKQLRPMIDLIISNRISNRVFAETRDTLLPLLLSGVIEIK